MQLLCTQLYIYTYTTSCLHSDLHIPYVKLLFCTSSTVIAWPIPPKPVICAWECSIQTFQPKPYAHFMFFIISVIDYEVTIVQAYRRYHRQYIYGSGSPGCTFTQLRLVRIITFSQSSRAVQVTLGSDQRQPCAT